MYVQVMQVMQVVHGGCLADNPQMLSADAFQRADGDVCVGDRDRNPSNSSHSSKAEWTTDNSDSDARDHGGRKRPRTATQTPSTAGDNGDAHTEQARAGSMAASAAVEDARQRAVQRDRLDRTSPRPVGWDVSSGHDATQTRPISARGASATEQPSDDTRAQPPSPGKTDSGSSDGDPKGAASRGSESSSHEVQSEESRRRTGRHGEAARMVKPVDRTKTADHVDNAAEDVDNNDAVDMEEDESKADDDGDDSADKPPSPPPRRKSPEETKEFWLMRMSKCDNEITATKHELTMVSDRRKIIQFELDQEKRKSSTLGDDSTTAHDDDAVDGDGTNDDGGAKHETSAELVRRIHAENGATRARILAEHVVDGKRPLASITPLFVEPTSYPAVQAVYSCWN